MRRLDVNAAEEHEERELTSREQDESLRAQAPAILEGIIAAAQNIEEEQQTITIQRAGKAYFRLGYPPSA